jgi:hypothetical protein
LGRLSSCLQEATFPAGRNEAFPYAGREALQQAAEVLRHLTLSNVFTKSRAGFSKNPPGFFINRKLQY